MACQQLIYRPACGLPNIYGRVTGFEKICKLLVRLKLLIALNKVETGYVCAVRCASLAQKVLTNVFFPIHRFLNQALAPAVRPRYLDPVQQRCARSQREGLEAERECAEGVDNVPQALPCSERISLRQICSDTKLTECPRTHR